ncbi:MAG TPA: 3-hydroxyacyl-CoA dehydrogenase NAD-binding domain-containing protein [Gemmataceae bacterium]|nr:3-hydroxyacyl-CoA dehydrogenase NAD-binding domain-containing protein [Gemmataceae bacterium]
MQHPYISGMAFFQSKHVWVKQLGDGVAALMLDRQQMPANFLDFAMLDDIERALDAIAEAKRYRLLFVRSAKTANFCHGPSAGLVASWTAADFTAWAERGQKVCGKLADLPIPSVCVITGSCYDAGLELALACDYRVVVDRASTQIGFPELEWGMIPCWGASQRLPHLIGLDNSLHMLMAGQRLTPREAWTCGLADEIAEEISEDPPAFLSNPVKRDWTEYPRVNWRQNWLESNRLGRWFLFRGAQRIVNKRIPEAMPAPGEMLGAIRQAFAHSTLQPGLDYERQAMERIATQPALRNLLRLLEHREHLRAQSISSNTKSRVQRVGVIGVETAGISLLLHSLTKGYQLTLRAADQDMLGAGLSQVIQLLSAEVQRGGMTSDQLQTHLGAIRGTFTWTHFDTLDLILDTMPGTLGDKQSLYREMEQHVPDSCLIVPVSPMQRIAELQEGLQHPERLIGIHLIEPWNRGSLAEIVATKAARPEHLQRLRDWAVSVGKCCLQVPDSLGGLAMRIWLPALNEAALLVKEGVPIDRIDVAMRRFGMTHGPCEWMDRLGIDRVARYVDALQPLFVGRIQFESGFAAMVRDGLLGNKSGSGFFRAGFRKRKPNAAAVVIWRTASQGEPARPTPALSEADSHLWIQNRIVTLMVLEAARCLEEGLASDADDLDCAMCLTGWATHRGGPIGFGRQLGADAFLARCEQLMRECGGRFSVGAAVRTLLS